MGGLRVIFTIRHHSGDIKKVTMPVGCCLAGLRILEIEWQNDDLRALTNPPYAEATTKWLQSLLRAIPSGVKLKHSGECQR